jgi:hypothetical protein
VLSHLTLSALNYGCRLLPVGAHKRPLIKNCLERASNDPAVVGEWPRQFGRFVQYAWALPATIVVADADESRNQRGLGDLERLAGCSPFAIATAMARSPTGGGHFIYAAGGRRYKTNVRLPGSAIDIKTLGGYIVVPDVYSDGTSNGREWLRAPWEAPLLPAPAWLNAVLKREEETRSPAERLDLPLSECDRQDARAELGRACVRIVRAECGRQDITRNAQCFFIGQLVEAGALSFDEAYSALLAAAEAMPTYRAGDPWHGLERKVERSLRAGMGEAP